MTVEDLIDELLKYPPNMSVVIDGYERGLVDLTSLSEKMIERNVNNEWYYGPHEFVDEGGEKVIYLD